MVYSFGAEDILAALGLTASTCEVQESGEDAQGDYADTKDNDGNVVAASETEHNLRTEKTITIKTKDPAAATPVTFTLGGVGTANVVITQFSVKKVYNDNATLSVTAHVHDDIEAGAVHLATPVSQAVSLDLGFGIDAVLLGGTLKECQSHELSSSIEHKDRLSNSGKFLVGASTGLRYECTEEYVDDGSEITVGAPWKQDSQAKKTVNQDFYTRTVKAHAYSLA
ncbi:MAG: hypothetical protein HQ559_07290 [Lentisphaerae bacterium]|nr:hypothetical protein [Lentisphaerota bacterium]